MADTLLQNYQSSVNSHFKLFGQPVPVVASFTPPFLSPSTRNFSNLGQKEMAVQFQRVSGVIRRPLEQIHRGINPYQNTSVLSQCVYSLEERISKTMYEVQKSRSFPSIGGNNDSIRVNRAGGTSSVCAVISASQTLASETTAKRLKQNVPESAAELLTKETDMSTVDNRIVKRRRNISLDEDSQIGDTEIVNATILKAIGSKHTCLTIDEFFDEPPTFDIGRVILSDIDTSTSLPSKILKKSLGGKYFVRNCKMTDKLKNRVIIGMAINFHRGTDGDIGVLAFGSKEAFVYQACCAKMLYVCSGERMKAYKLLSDIQKVKPQRKQLYAKPDYCQLAKRSVQKLKELELLLNFSLRTRGKSAQLEKIADLNFSGQQQVWAPDGTRILPADELSQTDQMELGPENCDESNTRNDNDSRSGEVIYLSDSDNNCSDRLENENQKLLTYLEKLKQELTALKTILQTTNFLESVRTPVLVDLKLENLQLLKGNSFVDSLQLNLDWNSRKNQFIVTCLCNDRYFLYGRKSKSVCSLTMAVNESLRKAKNCMLHVKSDASELCIPERSSDDLCLLASLFEARTGLSVDSLNIDFKPRLNRWRCLLELDDQVLRSALFVTKEEALQQLMLHYLTNFFGFKVVE